MIRMWKTKSEGAKTIAGPHLFPGIRNRYARNNFVLSRVRSHQLKNILIVGQIATKLKTLKLPVTIKNHIERCA
ncbi:MAG: hypothetical protein U0519_04670 [Candidatus Gracilibacteria bacterium]